MANPRLHVFMYSFAPKTVCLCLSLYVPGQHFSHDLTVIQHTFLNIVLGVLFLHDKALAQEPDDKVQNELIHYGPNLTSY